MRARTHSELAEYNEAQSAAIQRWMAATGLEPSQWVSMGYAAAFEAAWRGKCHERGHLYDVTLATAGRVRKIVAP